MKGCKNINPKLLLQEERERQRRDAEEAEAMKAAEAERKRRAEETEAAEAAKAAEAERKRRAFEAEEEQRQQVGSVFLRKLKNRENKFSEENREFEPKNPVLPTFSEHSKHVFIKIHYPPPLI